jgi:hypothetical protein
MIVDTLKPLFNASIWLFMFSVGLSLLVAG